MERCCWMQCGDSAAIWAKWERCGPSNFSARTIFCRRYHQLSAQSIIRAGNAFSAFLHFKINPHCEEKRPAEDILGNTLNIEASISRLSLPSGWLFLFVHTFSIDPLGQLNGILSDYKLNAQIHSGVHALLILKTPLFTGNACRILVSF